MEQKPVLALYGFRSKQEFIYRTNRMKEITGASELIAGMFSDFLTEASKTLRIDGEWKRGTEAALWQGLTPGYDAVVVYEGGGNLCIEYANREAYLTGNRIFSKLVIDRTYSMGLLAVCAPVTEDFSSDMHELHTNLEKKKQTSLPFEPINGLPFTQVDPVSYKPIVEKRSGSVDGYDVTMEGKKKRGAFLRKAESDRKWAGEGKFLDNIGSKKGEDSLIAVCYFDGNSIGARLKASTEGAVGYANQVLAMREFSIEVNHVLVARTERAIRDALAELAKTSEAALEQSSFRVVIDHGDEITLICNAHAVPVVLDAYFSSINEYNESMACAPELEYHASAGVAVFHPHAPFSEVYAIAEECCESGKKRNRAEGVNLDRVDFHFCRSGIVGSLDQIRGAQEAQFTARPYTHDAYRNCFLTVGNDLRGKVSRADVKGLSDCLFKGDSAYFMEVERLRAKAGDGCLLEELNEIPMKQVVFDVAGFYDLWFANGESAALTGKEAGDAD